MTAVVEDVVDAQVEEPVGEEQDPQEFVDVTEAAQEFRDQEAPEESGEGPAEPGTDVARRGSLDLSLSLDQESLTGSQWAALAAICNFDVTPSKHNPALPHVQAFLYICAKQNLDPWAREAYLIRRKGGPEGWQYTMQVGIDGYRKIAGDTGRFIRVSRVRWTGADDDERSWFFDKDTGTMHRVWWDHWPISKGYPGAAQVTVEHYDVQGNVTETTREAMWDFYCPMYEAWEDKPSGGGRQPVLDEQGRRVKEPGEFWRKGGPFMLAKVAEALALRSMSAGGMRGLYTHEEMQRADQVEAERAEKEKAQQRRQQMLTAGIRHGGRVVQGETVEEAPQAPQTPEREPREGQDETSVPLVPTGDSAPVVADVVEEVEPEVEAEATAELSEQEKAEQEAMAHKHLVAEFAWQAQVMGKSEDELSRRRRAMYRREVKDMTAAQLAALVEGLRSSVATKLHETGQAAESARYRQVEAGQYGPVEWLIGEKG